MTITVETSERVDIIDVTERVATAISDRIENGICVAFVPHTTAGIIVNEPEPRLLEDFKQFLATTVPQNADFQHDVIDNNADAHLRAAMLGSSITIPITEGKLALGTWQAILFFELDGPRSRRLEVTEIPTHPDTTENT